MLPYLCSWDRAGRRPKGCRLGRAPAEAAPACLGSHRARLVYNQALSSHGRLRVLMALWMALSVQALASSGQLCRTWRDKATGTAGKLAAAAAGHKKMLFRLSIIVLLVTLGEC